MSAPILRYRPDLVKEMPIFRLIIALIWEIPRNRQEKLLGPLTYDGFWTS